MVAVHSYAWSPNSIKLMLLMQCLLLQVRLTEMSPLIFNAAVSTDQAQMHVDNLKQSFANEFAEPIWLLS